MKWFRLHTEIKDDPKMLELDDHQFRVWISVLSMAGEADERGVIPAYRPRGMAASLHTTIEKMEAAFLLFAELGMAERREDGALLITNFIRRQYDNPSDHPEKIAARKARMKEREENDSFSPTQNQERVQNAAERVQNAAERDGNDAERLYSENTQRILREYSETETETENTQRQSPPDCQADAQSEIAQKVETLKTAEQKQVAPLPKQKKIPLPTEPETLEYFAAKGRPELASGFWDYWESVGWKRRGLRMDDWRATVRTWINRQDDKHAPPAPITFSNGSRASPNSGRPVNNPAQTIDDIAAEIMTRPGGQNELYTEQTASDFYGESQAITIQHQHALVGSNRADVPHRIP